MQQALSYGFTFDLELIWEMERERERERNQSEIDLTGRRKKQYGSGPESVRHGPHGC